MTRQEELTQELIRFSEAYYDQNAPVISDAEYDVLYDELVLLEQESGFVLPGSPTKRVGANAGAFLPHTHIRRLYSLDPAPLAELDAWLAPYRDFWTGKLDALGDHLMRSD